FNYLLHFQAVSRLCNDLEKSLGAVRLTAISGLSRKPIFSDLCGSTWEIAEFGFIGSSMLLR
ncbi:MAG: hypothetical protein M0Q93_13395, partial [Terrimicrobiaceae bacterium]|nr:hypothetical protein [Terrimicrobiaceae bacterium]